jgi:hypothetical protein
MCQLVTNDRHAEFMYVFRDIMMALSDQSRGEFEIYEAGYRGLVIAGNEGISSSTLERLLQTVREWPIVAFDNKDGMAMHERLRAGQEPYGESWDDRERSEL